MTAAIYARLSQDRTGEAQNVDHQVARCRDLAERLGLPVSAVYTDNDLSATSGKVRPGFEALLAADHDVWLCWHTDRLVRVSKDLERVLDRGVTVHAVTAGHLDLSTPAGRAVARTVTAWATYEGEQRTLRQRAASDRLAATGRPNWGSRTPWGYLPTGEPSEPAAEAVRAGYAAVLDGGTLADVRRAWDAVGPTPYGKPWTTTSVRSVLLNARNAGLRTLRGEVIGQGTWTPLVDEATYRAVCSILRASNRGHGKPTKRSRLLTGVARCPKCGATVVGGWTASRKGGSVPAYRCRTQHMQRNAEPIERRIIADTLAVLTLPGAREVITHRERPDADALRIERAQLTERRNEWLTSGMAPADVRTALAPVDARITAIDAALVDDTRADLFGRFYGADFETWRAGSHEAWDSLPLHQRQTILRTLWDDITLGADPVPSELARRIRAEHEAALAALSYRDNIRV